MQRPCLLGGLDGREGAERRSRAVTDGRIGLCVMVAPDLNKRVESERRYEPVHVSVSPRQLKQRAVHVSLSAAVPRYIASSATITVPSVPSTRTCGNRSQKFSTVSRASASSFVFRMN